MSAYKKWIRFCVIKRFVAAAAVGGYAFLELCLTGQAASAWRMARRDVNEYGRERSGGTGAGYSRRAMGGPIVPAQHEK